MDGSYICFVLHDFGQSAMLQTIQAAPGIGTGPTGPELAPMTRSIDSSMERLRICPHDGIAFFHIRAQDAFWFEYMFPEFRQARLLTASSTMLSFPSSDDPMVAHWTRISRTLNARSRVTVLTHTIGYRLLGFSSYGAGSVRVFS